MARVNLCFLRTITTYVPDSEEEFSIILQLDISNQSRLNIAPYVQ